MKTTLLAANFIQNIVKLYSHLLPKLINIIKFCIANSPSGNPQCLGMEQSTRVAIFIDRGSYRGRLIVVMSQQSSVGSDCASGPSHRTWLVFP